MRRGFVAAVVAGGVLAFGAAPALASELRVDDDHAQCPSAQYTSIQAAVNAAGQNDTVLVCPGTYTEQVRIQTHQKDGLKLRSRNPEQATIKAPPAQTSPRTIVLIEEANRVTVTGFVISGPFTEPTCGVPLPSDPAVIDTYKGVYVKNAFGAAIAANHITLIRNSNPLLFGCQDGISVLVGRSGEAATGSALVAGNLIDEYQKGGVVVDNTGSYGVIAHNVIRASTAVQPNIAPNGVQISRGAGAWVTHNKVSRNKFLGDRNAGSGSGILLFQPGARKVDVDHNESFDNDDGLPLIDADRESIEHNYSHDNVIFDGLFADSDSTGNVFKDNVALRDEEHDCHDDSVGSGMAGTANVWKDNTGVTQTPAGICRPPKSGGHGGGHGGGGHAGGRSAARVVSPMDAGSALPATRLGVR